MKPSTLFFLFILCPFLSVAQQKAGPYRSKIELKGDWEFQTSSVGVFEEKGLKDMIHLPGTMDENRKGRFNKDTTTMHLNRRYTYEGKAWYRKKVTIPANFENKHIILVLERTKHTEIWVDGVLAGSSSLLQTAQEFDLSTYLTPGEHQLLICVNNSLKLTPYGNVHIYSDDTETNWNGIIGQIYLEASGKNYINDLQVYPSIKQKKFDIRIGLNGGVASREIMIELQPELKLGGKTIKLESKRLSVTWQPEISLSYSLKDKQYLWDEYDHVIYELKVIIRSGKELDSKSVSFGMREFSRSGTQFSINGRNIFLRGKNDACVFPLTGYPPMEPQGWERVFRIARSYGINHYRFHSWCPPEAAFVAADRIGIYLQVELPFWGGLDNDTLASRLLSEGLSMLRQYGNHPSFVMLSHGNEIWGGHERVEKNLRILKEYDKRHLYTMGSNVNIGYKEPTPSTDYFVGARVPYGGDTTLTHTRLTHAFADTRDGGILNTFYPSSTVDFSFPVYKMPMPVVSHEVGQYQIFPDYSEISKYTGVLEARNLMVFQKRLKQAGMENMDHAFQQASGAWSGICYKAEMEAALRTKGMAGFQLLDLQDFPGQGTALIGILDAFMDSKNVISRRQWINSCNDVVLLASLPKYCWYNIDTLVAEITVANYSNHDLNAPMHWEIRDAAGAVFAKGTFSLNNFKKGTLIEAGKINCALGGIKKSRRLSLIIYFANSDYRNEYPVWVYPHQQELAASKDEIITSRLDEVTISKLENGARVLLFPNGDSLKSKTIEGLFPPEFWNWGMFKSISESNHKKVSPGTLGILTDPAHPLFKQFPTESHTNWQWFSIVKNSRALILDNLEKSYRPIVQVIDNLERNHKLGMVMEFRYGKGRLLVYMANLGQVINTPEIAQFHYSLLTYFRSADFKPSYEIKKDELISVISPN